MERSDGDFVARVQCENEEELRALWDGATTGEEQRQRELISLLKRGEKNVNRMTAARLKECDPAAVEFVYQAFFVYVDGLLRSLAVGMAGDDRRSECERVKLADSFFVEFVKQASAPLGPLSTPLDEECGLKCQIYLRLLRYLRGNGLLNAGHELGLSSEDGLQGRGDQPISVTVLGTGSAVRAKRRSREGYDRREDPQFLSDALKRLGRDEPALFRVVALHYFGRRGYRDLCQDLELGGAAVLGEMLLRGLRSLRQVDPVAKPRRGGR